jgi:hypothetical protein
VGFVEEALGCSVFEGSVHAFDLAIGPGMLGLGQPVVDAGLGAGELEGMSQEHLAMLHGQLDFGRCRAGVSRRSEVGSVVGKHGVDLVRNSLEQGAEEIAGHAPGGLFMHLDEGELRGTVDGDQEIELALFGAHLRQINMEVADRIGLELLAPGPVALHIGQPGDATALQAAMQRRAGQLRNRGPKRIQAVVERKQRMPAESNDNGFLFKGLNRRLRCRPGAPVRDPDPLPSLGDGLRVHSMPPGHGSQALLTMLYRSVNCRCRAGTPVSYLSHSASFWRSEMYAPSISGTIHLAKAPESQHSKFGHSNSAGYIELEALKVPLSTCIQWIPMQIIG